MKSTTSRGGVEADGVSGDFICIHDFIYNMLLMVDYTTIQTFDCMIMILCHHKSDDDGQVDVIENLVLAR